MRESLAPPAPRLSSLGQAVVILAVFAVLLFGIVVLAVRQEAVSAHQAALAAVSPTPTATSRPRATPTPTGQPPDAPGTYTVRRGDSLFEIAAAIGVSANELVYWNVEAYPSLRSSPAVKVGWVLATSGPPMPTPIPTPTPRPAPASTPPPQVAGLEPITAALFPASDRVTVSFYDVTGSTPREIGRSVEANGPWSDWTQSSVQAQVVTELDYDISFQTGGDGSCEVVAQRSPPMTFTYTVVLPRWTPPAEVSQLTVEWWIDEMADTVRHEGRHIEIYESALPALNAAVTTGTCDSLSASIQSIMLEVNRENCQFDLDEYGYAAGLTMESCLAS